MSIPNNPTGSSIVTEALNKAGIGTPSADELTRAEDLWLEEIKNDIYNAAKRNGSVRFKTLQTWE